MVLTICGVNYKSASLATRELLASGEEEVKHLLEGIKNHNQITECLILSTCNRFEIYTVSEVPLDICAFLLNFMGKERDISLENRSSEFYSYGNTGAVSHLFRVISGLDSMITGEPQIAGQVRKAYSLANHARTNGVVLHRLFHRAFRVSKRIRHETSINRGAGSVGFVAIELAGSIYNNISSCSCLLIGAGKIAAVTAKNLFERNINSLFIANRTYQKAREMAGRLGGTPVNFEHITDYINQADIIISTTGSRDYIVTAEMMEALMAKRTRGKLLIIDIAVPRDFDPEIEKLPGVHLVNINGLKEIVKDNLKNRAAEIPKAEAIIEEEKQLFLEWKETLKINHLIKSITRKYEAVREGEMRRVRKNSTASEAEHMDKLTRHLVRKLVSIPIRGLKDVGHSSRYLNMISRLFDLDEVPPDLPDEQEKAEENNRDETNPDSDNTQKDKKREQT